MSITHAVFDVFAFTVALLELIHLYREGKVTGRRWIIPTLIVVLIGLCGVVVSGWLQHKAALLRAENRISEILRVDPHTFDELAHSLDYDDLPFISEALGSLVSSGRVGHDDIRLSQPDGSIQHEIRLYHLTKSQLPAVKENNQ